MVLVGDTIRYTVTVTNTRPGTCWYDAVVRDHIPAGLSYVAGSAVVTEDALGTDIGNVAFAYGTDPSGTETTVLTGDPSGTPGWRSEGIDGLEQAASEGTAFRSESKVTYPEGYDGQVRPNPAGDGDTKLKMRRLAKTGDEVPLALPLGLAMLAASALAVIALAARTNRRARG